MAFNRDANTIAAPGPNDLEWTCPNCGAERTAQQAKKAWSTVLRCRKGVYGGCGYEEDITDAFSNLRYIGIAPGWTVAGILAEWLGWERRD